MRVRTFVWEKKTDEREFHDLISSYVFYLLDGCERMWKEMRDRCFAAFAVFSWITGCVSECIVLTLANAHERRFGSI